MAFTLHKIDKKYEEGAGNEQHSYHYNHVFPIALKITEEALGADHPAHLGFKKLIEKGVMDGLAGGLAESQTGYWPRI